MVDQNDSIIVLSTELATRPSSRAARLEPDPVPRTRWCPRYRGRLPIQRISTPSGLGPNMRSADARFERHRSPPRAPCTFGSDQGDPAPHMEESTAVAAAVGRSPSV